MKKLIEQSQSEIFERIVRSGNGRVFRVRFVVVEREGILRGRVVSCVALNFIPSSVVEGCPDFSGDGVVLFLSTEKKTYIFNLVQKIGAKVASPYFNKFAFLTAIKIRAPAFAADGRGLHAD